MLLEKSSLDQINIEMVTDGDILLVDINKFLLDEVSYDMVTKKIKFVVVVIEEEVAILSSHDLLSLQISKKSIKSFIDENKKLVDSLDSEMHIGKFLILHENSNLRYYPVQAKGKIIGIIDKREVIRLYTEVDDKNNRLITSILDNINDAVCIIDVRARVKFWNKSAEKLYEITREKILDKHLLDYFPSALLPKVLVSKNKVTNIYNLPKEGCHNLISASPLYDNGIIIGAISYDKDISEQIMIAENLKETESNLQVLQDELMHIGEERYSFDNIVGSDSEWLEIVKLVKMVSKSMINILILGESGTGKEVLARATHIESNRKGLFVPINCSAIPKDLFESELFGYKSGAFSGALKAGKIGKFEFANLGTIFLDEIGDMPLEMQAKLLRLLEDGEVTPVGGNESIKVDVRIISASNKNLLDLIDKNLFRKDLYYRLNGVGVSLSPLRERKGDIVILAKKFIEDFKTIHKMPRLTIPNDIINLLCNYHWEGNIRELKNIIERTVILSKNNGYDEINESFLPEVIRKIDKNKKIVCSYALNELIERTEKNAIKEALMKTTSKADAAKMLQIPRSTLYFKMDKYQM